jgi:hypothetical protein
MGQKSYTQWMAEVPGNGAQKLLIVVILITALFICKPASADIKLNGFGSVAIGTVIEGDEFLADYANTGIYNTDLSMDPDTTLGVQLSSYFTDEFSFIVQAAVNGASDYDPEIDWLYLNYYLTPELSVQLGRKRLPLYYYSDYLNIGYAYYWIRPPPDVYTWQINNYNGVSLVYEVALGQWDTSLNIYYGSEESEDNDLLSLLFGASVDETWKDMVGIVGMASNNWLELRLSHMQGLIDRTISGVAVTNDIEQQFTGLSINLTFGSLLILSEFNNYKQPDNSVEYNAYLLSLGYRIGEVTPNITRSGFKQDINALGNDENHHTTSVGLRWDVADDIAVKVQYDNVVDEGVVVPVKGDSKTISFALDFVF